MAGGKGTRVEQLYPDLPKSLIPLNGKPVIQHQLETLKKEGIKEVTISLGYLSDSIIDFIRINNDFGIKITYVIESEPLGTAGSLSLLDDPKEDFVLVYGDIIFDISVKRFLDYHLDKQGIATLLLHPNDHPYDSDLVQCDVNGKVVSFIMKNQEKDIYNNNVNSGLFVLSPKILKHIPARKADLVNDILPRFLSSGIELYGYNSSEYVKDMGSPERIVEIEESLKSGEIRLKNLSKKQKAVFLDRDGVINDEVDQLIRIEDFSFLEGSISSIKKLNRSDFLSVVVTNQPAVAKGFCKIEDIDNIHRYMETRLGKEGAKLDAIYYCPCHPDKGFLGENLKYKRDCKERKPNTGMLDLAREKFNIDYSKSYIVGDSTRDILAGKRAGVRTILVKTGNGGKDAQYDVEPDYVAKDLNQAVHKIILKN